MKNLFYIVLLLFPGRAFDQIYHPVRWSYGIKKISTHEYQVHLKADVEDGWHVYAQLQPKNAVAKPTRIVITKNAGFETVGAVKEIGKLERLLNREAGIGANQYEHTVDFVQVIRLKQKTPQTISGTITFQTCTDKMCLPPEDKPFTIPIR